MNLNSPFYMPKEGVFPYSDVQYLDSIEHDYGPERKGKPTVFNDLKRPCRRCHLDFPRNAKTGLCFFCSRDDPSHGLGQRSLLGIADKTYVELKDPKFERNQTTKGPRLPGYVLPEFPMVVTRPTIGAEQKALENRQNCTVPQVDKKLFHEFEEFCSFDHLDGHPLFPEPIIKCATFRDAHNHKTGKNWTFEDWNRHFPPARRKQHASARERYEHFEGLSKREADKWCRVAMFPKTEKLDQCGNDYAPRVISGFDPRVSAFVGPEMTVIQEYFHRNWNGISVPILLAAGATTADISSMYNRIVDSMGVCFETDMSNFDSTVADPFIKLWMKLIRNWGFEDSHMFWSLKAAQSRPLFGFGICGSRFLTKVDVKSGMSDTCIVNSVMNAMVHLFCVAKTGKLYVNGKLSLRLALDTVSMAVMGDDNMGSTTVKDAIQIAYYMKKLGWIPKFKIVDDPRDLTFLNMIPYPIEGGILFAPKLGRLVQRLPFAVQDQGDWRAYNCAMGKGFLQSCAHVPVLRAYVARLARCGQRVDGKNHDRGLELDEAFRRRHFGYVQNVVKHVEPKSACVETFEFMCRRYGCTKDEISAKEIEIANWPDPPCLVQDSFLARAVGIDR